MAHTEFLPRNKGRMNANIVLAEEYFVVFVVYIDFSIRFPRFLIIAQY